MSEDKKMVRTDEQREMLEEHIENRDLSAEELADQELTIDQEVTELPERDNMSLINANVAAPINLAAALNVASDNSIAYAEATQTAPITQTT